MTIEMTPDEKKWLDETAANCSQPIKDSAIFLSLCTPGFEKDPLAVMQFGFAVLMNKPIFLLVPEGHAISPYLWAIAKSVFSYKEGDMASLELATRQCVSMAQSLGLIGGARDEIPK